ncbi:MAG: hypothetical protein NTZ26_02210 [Candidatus Aminicenantes bacterium]|nr:hypothetical protein [Candidatus Aminicenantes bacterium]
MLPTRKATTWLLAVLLAAGSVFGQSMVETAKKEKERREAAKKGTTTVVTNADLGRTKKKAAMVVVREGAPAADAEERIAPGDKPRPSAVAAPSAVPDPKAGAEVLSEAAVDFNQKKSELQTANDKAQERAELLDLKMRALNQQFFTFNSMASKDQIQKAIAETYQKLQDAQAEATKAKAALEQFLNQAASAKQAPIWIKKP